jgi:hypothetical protein
VVMKRRRIANVCPQALQGIRRTVRPAICSLGQEPGRAAELFFQDKGPDGETRRKMLHKHTRGKMAAEPAHWMRQSSHWAVRSRTN